MAARARKRATNTIHTMTSGTTIRIEEPSGTSSRKAKPNPAVVIIQEANPVGGFVNFLREHAVVGLAIGFIIGVQAQGLVRSLVSSFIDPAFLLLFGQKLNQRTFTLEWHDRVASFSWGSFAYGLLNFLFVLAVIYAIVKILNLDKLEQTEKAKEAAKNVPPTAVR